MHVPKERPTDPWKANAKRRAFQDPRRPVQEPRKSSLANIKPEVLKSPLPQRRQYQEASGSTQQNKLQLTCAKTLELSELVVRLIIRLWSDATARLCTASRPGAATQERRDTESAPRRWYRVYPISDTTYFVRADAGMGGRIPGHGFSQDGAYRFALSPEYPGKVACYRYSPQPPRRHCSLPATIERRVGLPSDGLDHFRGVCQICCDQQNEVIVLPCRHGGMCEKCLRRAVYSKPLHRGGLTCPLCRRAIWEVIRIHDEAVRPQYGYSIMVSPALAPARSRAYSGGSH